MTTILQKGLAVRSLTAAFGLFLYSFGLYLTIQASIGVAPWEVLALGIAERTGFLYGNIALTTSIILLLIDLLMKEKLGIGSILDALICGKAVDLFNWLELVPQQTDTLRGILMLVAGLFIMAFGQWIYMLVGLGCGPRDAFLVAVGKWLHRLPIGVVQNGILLVVLAAGWLLGGPVGIGTLISVVGMGTTMQLVFRLVRFEPRDVVHQGLMESIKNIVKGTEE